jgi:Zn finger protein HypA/HybF involved in hydrogenase expression
VEADETAQVASLHRTLDQELTALLRGASLECLVCGEFVMHARGGSIFCPECSSQLADEDSLESELPNAALEWTVQAG